MMGYHMGMTVHIHDEGDDGFWAEVAELPGCFAASSTRAGLSEALDDAVRLYLTPAP